MAGIIAPGEVMVGLQLPVQAQSPTFASPWEAGSGTEDLAAIAEAADLSGLGYVAVCDHVAIPDDRVAVMGSVWFDTVATLGFLAARTTRVHLLSHVYVAAYRHGLVTAKAFGTLDVLSGGRVILGVGVGHVEGEFEALGVPFGRRGALLDEALEVITGAWGRTDTGGSGTGVRVAPAPVRPGGPPIWVGGSSRAALRRAARHDGWLPQGPPPEGMRAAIAELGRLREEAGTADEAFDVGILTEPVHVGASKSELPPHTLSGEPEHIAQRLGRYRGLGCNQLQVRFAATSASHLVDQLGRFGAEVLPGI